ncbi:MAG: ABC transporter ATP-binding protein [Planctomycetes bacterium]|nr:ABC transporter ATP-binding protein [Planctomycetota bacterium]
MASSVLHPIAARGLVRRFGDLTAVAGIDLEARAGSCLGLLGPNGAGKTTTIEMLEGLQSPDEGEISILGRSWATDAAGIRERIGVQLQETSFQDKLSVQETLSLFASFYRRPRPVPEVLALVNLTEKATARVHQLSGGQRQRLALGCALVNAPEVLFLDEPTTGLDPQARRRVWEIVEEFKRAGGAVLLTTHYMDEAERLADDLVIVDHGKVIARGTPPEIIRSLAVESIVEFSLAEGSTLDAGQLAELGGLPGVIEARNLAGGYLLEVDDTRAALGSLIGWLERSGTVATDIGTHRPTLEDVFVSLTGKHLREA